ncbi:MAG: hypothetical protein CM1200mP40_05640 [Gammaproteobacteria bacterium]|jgi:uncharacterized protein (DUF305 family)|nr:MAG: hypothetical protein CM1200mP40_05640 [Gammaproteobacteria bacterium]
MKSGYSKITSCLLLALSGLVATQSLAQVPIIQPGAPGQPGRIITAEEASDLASIQYSAGDVMFLQGMISHHAQAMEMSALVESRSNRETMNLMAERISLSQDDEISMMQDWLGERDLEVPSTDAHHAGDYNLMPGMLTNEDMAQLEAASGDQFDRLFLEFMIQHHEGALEMVENLLDQRGAAQDPVLYAFTSDVTSDQSAEIDRMDLMLAGFNPDPRVNLEPGFRDAGEAALNLQLVASLPKPDGFFDPENPSGLPNRPEPEESLGPDDEEVDTAEELTNEDAVSGLAETPADEDEEENENDDPRPSLLSFSNTDLLFSGDYLVAGNYHGFNTYDISNPSMPQHISSVVCPGGQGDVSLVGNLLIMSVQETRGRLDCGLEGVPEPNSQERVQGIRIFDISDFSMPIQVGAVQTCRGSHTHTVVSEPNENNIAYVYVSGTSGVRDDEELAGCSDDSPFENSESALFRIEVIEIPMERPEDARIINRPFIFADPDSGVLAGLWEGGDHGPDTQDTRETNQCHDITTFPEIGLAAGACSGNGILLDISDPANPLRIDQVIDPGFAYWHSATFNNDGTKVIFTDEWGGGGRPRCRASDPMTWGADAFYDIVDGQLEFRSHYKLSAPQTDTENCVAHNGSLIPVPGRDIFVQAWYQGGVSVVDFTDSSNPVEIAFFDRGPLDEEELITAGYWSTYWYGGHIYGTEIARGLDVFSLEPSDFITANEIAAASLKDADLTVNAQTQQQVMWPDVPVVARAYMDQLQRSNVIAGGQVLQLNTALDQAEGLLSSNSSNSGLANELDELAEAMEDEGNDRNGRSRARYLSLATTLEGIAGQLR